jgi:phosphatidylinositol-3-phosphatase
VGFVELGYDDGNYASKHDPLVYLTDVHDNATQAINVVPFTLFATDLAANTFPNYSFIVPNLCNDGHDAPCVDGKPGGLVSANAWLQRYVPPILRSPAYKDHGLLIVTFDEAESHDATACCNEQPGPNTTNPGGSGPGGGTVGAVLLSPCISPGTTTQIAYNHYSLLRSVEDNFGLSHLGFAGQAGLRPLDEAVLNRPACDWIPPSTALDSYAGPVGSGTTTRGCKKKRKHARAAAAKKCKRKRK